MNKKHTFVNPITNEMPAPEEPLYSVMVSTTEFPYQPWVIRARSEKQAIHNAMRHVFGFRSAYSNKTHRVYRLGRHGRIRKILAENVRVTVSSVTI